MNHKHAKKLQAALYNNLMDGISYYELKYDVAPPELYAAARENTPNLLKKIKLYFKEIKSKNY